MADVEIGWRKQESHEVRPWAIDMSLEMDAGDSINSVAAALTDLLTGTAFPAGLGASAHTGTVATQIVTSLVPGHNYRLVLTANMGGSKQTSTVLLLQCPY